MHAYLKDEERIADAIELLRRARDLFKKAKCPKTVERVRLALTSAGGAQRAAAHREYRDERTAHRKSKRKENTSAKKAFYLLSEILDRGDLSDRLVWALRDYEATGDHNHGCGSIAPGALCAGGACIVARARNVLGYCPKCNGLRVRQNGEPVNCCSNCGHTWEFKR